MLVDRQDKGNELFSTFEIYLWEKLFNFKLHNGDLNFIRLKLFLNLLKYRNSTVDGKKNI